MALTPHTRSMWTSTKVVRIALENAVSVASVLLLTEATMTEIPEEKREREAGAEMAV